MIAGLIRWSIANRFLVLLATVLIAAWGVWALVKTPLAFSSYPINAPSQRTTVCSIWVAEGEERHEVTLAFKVDASRSAKAPTGVDGEAT